MSEAVVVGMSVAVVRKSGVGLRRAVVAECRFVGFVGAAVGRLGVAGESMFGAECRFVLAAAVVVEGRLGVGLSMFVVVFVDRLVGGRLVAGLLLFVGNVAVGRILLCRLLELV